MHVSASGGQSRRAREGTRDSREFARAFTTLQNGTNTREQHLFADWLAQESGRADLETAVLNLRAGYAGNENGRRVDALLDHDLEQAHSVESGDVDIQQQHIE